MGPLALGIDDCLLRELAAELDEALSPVDWPFKAVVENEDGGFFDGRLSPTECDSVSGDGFAAHVLCIESVPPCSESLAFAATGYFAWLPVLDVAAEACCLYAMVMAAALGPLGRAFQFLSLYIQPEYIAIERPAAFTPLKFVEGQQVGTNRATVSRPHFEQTRVCV